MQVGDHFAVLTSGSGDILLKPIGKKAGKSWLRSLRGLKGLEITRLNDPVRDIEL
jgi:hypothetical protein